MLTLREREQSRQILIVDAEDDVTTEALSQLLETAGFTTVAVDEGLAALRELQTSPPDLVILNTTLPDLDGVELLRQMRERSSLPLIAVSDRPEDRTETVRVLEAGADDLVARHAPPEEMMARISALLRRVEWSPANEPRLEVRQLSLDVTRRMAFLHDRKLQLTPIEYSILITLMRSAGHVVPHADLLKSVWRTGQPDDYSVLRVNISRLRQKLKENPRRPGYIVTVPGRGYMMPAGRP
ncbi:MAG TPA: response regulator transcription factor [Candidatus Limnocylindrales bacterium]|nr:response regulator transcription factor [Candidatus Limnocylindrales bacterium]